MKKEKTWCFWEGRYLLHLVSSLRVEEGIKKNVHSSEATSKVTPSPMFYTI